jgi:hypothetical protein
LSIAICTIQRNRAAWIKEWVAFHHLIGASKFYIYLHKCNDESATVVTELSRHFDISAFVLSDDVLRPQLAAYKHCYFSFGQNHDWIAFIDGDEFLFPTTGQTITEHFEYLFSEPIDAIGVYWACFGSSGHIKEPTGLVTENYRQRAPLDFGPNRHFKSIVRGSLGQSFSVLQNSHYFQTNQGTFDTQMRSLTNGFVGYEPCYERLRINHYVTQSREYFLEFKQHSGSADMSASSIRTEEWWQRHDNNEIWDDSLERFMPDLHTILKSLNFI